MLIGLLALATGKTSEIIIISVFGALTLYILSMISLIRLRKKEPHLHRPFRVPLYPLFPALALIIAILALVAMFIYNFVLGAVYASLVIIGLAAYKIFKTADP
jgi:ethanolamine permease